MTRGKWQQCKADAQTKTVRLIQLRASHRSPSPYSDQRTRTRASSSGDGRTVGGKRSPPHCERRGSFQERVASINIRFQRPVPSCATSRSSMGVLGLLDLDTDVDAV